MNVGLGRGGLVGEDVCVARRVGRGIVVEERDLVVGVLTLPPLRETSDGVLLVAVTLMAERVARAVLGVRIVPAAIVCLIDRKGVLAVVLVVLAVIASRGNEVVTGAAVRILEPDAVDI